MFHTPVLLVGIHQQKIGQGGLQTLDRIVHSSPSSQLNELPDADFLHSAIL